MLVRPRVSSASTEPSDGRSEAPFLLGCIAGRVQDPTPSRRGEATGRFWNLPAGSGGFAFGCLGEYSRSFWKGLFRSDGFAPGRLGRLFLLWGITERDLAVFHVIIIQKASHFFGNTRGCHYESGVPDIGFSFEIRLVASDLPDDGSRGRGILELHSTGRFSESRHSRSMGPVSSLYWDS